MHTIEIPQKDLIVEIPSEWDECTSEQVHFILGKAFQVINGTLSLAEFRIQIFVLFTGLKFGPGYHIKQRLGYNAEINERIYLLSEQLCGWIFEKNEQDGFELSYQTITNFFPVLLNKYHGPDDLLADITLAEFKQAIAMLNDYFETKEDPDRADLFLNYFIATLYRPKDKSGIKVPFHSYVVEPTLFERVEPWRKQAIAIWFSYCIKCLQEEDLVIQGIDVNFSALFPSGKANPTTHKRVNLGWAGVVLDIAESGVFGDASKTSQTLLYDILIFLLKKHNDQSKQK
ncbi:MAG TPA: hypothetical protein H9825_09060 [Candidatus Sphingobacterium stercorigallinarum]|nr:hypothetical protein [Candidatus Sphingobacterium stercorigallinarum]